MSFILKKYCSSGLKIKEFWCSFIRSALFFFKPFIILHGAVPLKNVNWIILLSCLNIPVVFHYTLNEIDVILHKILYNLALSLLGSLCFSDFNCVLLSWKDQSLSHLKQTRPPFFFSNLLSLVTCNFFLCQFIISESSYILEFLPLLFSIIVSC